MKSDLVVRDARIEDLPGIMEIYNAAVLTRMSTADTDPVHPDSRQRWFAEHNPQHRPLWVLDDPETGKSMDG